MSRSDNLTKTEREIMECLWRQNREVGFQELLNYFNNELDKNWKKQTLSTYLKNLQIEGMIGVNLKGRKTYYYALCSEKEYSHSWTKRLVNENFNNSLSKFVAAFVGDSELTEEEKESLRKLI